ncbi:hypothetical protein CKK33_01910 [Mucilaginibacter sp. MD40]|uniref:TlpA disulfide reductase family protein n=1 Tax=Mucilaginibacter sp. MD40 TaxID=2029590 RepID=UPI000BAC7A6C|nr:TlpA disulfide reductase family protein [Mucilaginibacter sp. MD40]PAW92313.1 hypothetical protein CKK33_01910 [Mucilaginibacter sp. MD40]
MLKKIRYQRKALLLLPIALLVLAGFSLQGYIITGTMKATDGTVLRLSYRYGEKRFIDSVRILNNTFKFKGSLPEAVVCTLSNSANQQIRIFVAENRLISVNGNVERLVQATVSNGREDSLYHEFKALSTAVFEKFAPQMSRAAKRDTSSNIYKAYMYSRDSLLQAFVMKNSRSTAAALAIIDFYVNNPDRRKAEAAYQLLSPAGKSTIYARNVKMFIDAEKMISPGHNAPEFSLKDANGKIVKLSDYRGKYVFLDFWASWCVPCRKENPLLVTLHQQYGKEQLHFVSVSMDSNKSQWLAAVSKDGLTWTQLDDPESINGQVADAYGIKAVPFNCIIGPDGRIIAVNLRGENLRSFVDNLFKPH